jgi:hypothetical protein
MKTLKALWLWLLIISYILGHLLTFVFLVIGILNKDINMTVCGLMCRVMIADFSEKELEKNGC